MLEAPTQMGVQAPTYSPQACGMAMHLLAEPGCGAAAKCQRLSTLPPLGCSGGPDDLEWLCYAFGSDAGPGPAAPVPPPSDAAVVDAAAAAAAAQLERHLEAWQQAPLYSLPQPAAAPQPQAQPQAQHAQPWGAPAQHRDCWNAPAAQQPLPSPGTAVPTPQPCWEQLVLGAAQLSAAGCGQPCVPAPSADCGSAPPPKREAAAAEASLLPGGVEARSELSLLFARAAAAAGHPAPIQILTCASPAPAFSSCAEDTVLQLGSGRGSAADTRWFDRIDSSGRSGAPAPPAAAAHAGDGPGTGVAKQRRGRKYSEAELAVMAAEQPSRYKRIMCTRKSVAAHRQRQRALREKLRAEAEQREGGPAAETPAERMRRLEQENARMRAELEKAHGQARPATPGQPTG